MTLTRAIAAVLVLLAAALGALAALGGGADSDIPFASLQKHGASRSLVVLLHAFGNSPADMQQAALVVGQRMPDADVLVPSYLSTTFANSDPRMLATELDRRLEALYRSAKAEGGPYQKIILVGHSIGALVVRRAYLYGRGYRADYADPEQRAFLPTGQPHEWVSAVDRLVLLASMNRGWELEMIDNRSWTTQIRVWLGVTMARLTGTGGLFLSVQRGSPFISNLRLDWIRMVRSEPAAAPPVIQILGSKDDLVAPGDDVDAITAPNFVFMRVDGTDHGNIIDMADVPGAQAARRAHFSRALVDNVDRLRELFQSNTSLLTIDPRVRHVVFIKHGIRDMADWSSPLRTSLERFDQATRVINQKYPYFSMLSFLLVWDRQRQVRHFVDEYIQAVAENPNADKISYIGHSFGTYILASALEGYDTVRFHRVYFAGSVVRRDFPWHRFKDRFASVRNDRAAADWVVAIFPRTFEQLRALPGLGKAGYLDVGSAGVNGFTDDVASRLEVKYLPGGHAAALDFDRGQATLKSIVAYVTADDPSQVAAPNGLVSTVPWWITVAGQIAWLVCLLIVVAALAGWYAVWRALPAGRMRAAALVGYVVLLGFLFNTV